MGDKLTNLYQLRLAATMAKELSAQVAVAASEAIEELAGKSITMEQVNAAISDSLGTVEAALAKI